MLKRMRWRFILAATTSMFTVLFLLTAGINAWNYSVTVRRQDGVLSRLLESGHPSPHDSGREPPSGAQPWGRSPESRYAMRFFSVRCDENGAVVDVFTDFIATINEQNAGEYAASVLLKGKNAGYYGEYRYMVSRDESGATVVFLNSSFELESMKTLLYISCGVAFISLLAAAGLVIAFSKRAIAPIVNNIEQQKRFITDAGHEIKTPLTSIATSADVIAMERGDDEWTENIKRQTARLTKLVNGLVTLSHLDEAMPFPDKTAFSLSDVAWETAEHFAALAGATGKAYSQRIDDGLELCGDKASIQQLISILLDNAVKYSDAGGQIRFEVYRERGSTVISVNNTCKLEGVTDVNRLFDRFYRPDASRASDTGGTGIGLSIAKAIAETHGGAISAKLTGSDAISFKVKL